MPDDKKINPLALLGIKDEGPDLLEEALSGKLGSPATHPTDLNFTQVKQDIHNQLNQSQEDEDLSFDLGNKKVSEGAAPTKPAEQPKPKSQPAHEEEETEEPPAWVHSLNQEQETTRQRQDAIERALQQERQQINEQLARIQQQTAPRQQQQRHISEDELYELGFTDQSQYDKVINHIRQQTVQEMQRITVPMMQQMAWDRFQSAISQAESRHEHFSKYFTRDSLNTYFVNLLRAGYSPQALAQANWDVEFSNAYRTKDYDRLASQVQKADDKTKTEDHKKQEEKEARKANLKLVPKAHQQGADTKRSINDEYNELPKDLDMRGLAKWLKPRAGIQ